MAKHKILIIDDDLVALKVFKRQLEDDFDVIIENAGYRLVDNPEEYDADLIFLDMEMPVMNGLDVFEKYMSLPIKKKPVVFLTGLAEPEVVREVMEKGAAGYMLKTSPKDDIVDKVNKVLEQYVDLEKMKDILVVGKNVNLLVEIRNIVEDDYKRVQLMNNTLAAIEYVRTHPLDLVILCDNIDENMKSHFGLSGAKVMMADSGMDASQIAEKAVLLFEED